MNQKIKDILKKKGFTHNNPILLSIINNALIEICELQKEECANESKIRFWDGFHKEGKLIEHFQSGGDNLTPSKESILNSKNIAE